MQEITYPMGSLIPILEIRKNACGASMLFTFNNSGVPRSSKTLMNTNAAPAIYPGIASGKTMRRKSRNP